MALFFFFKNDYLNQGYELREGLTPANYDMKGSPAGLARIDRLFGGHGYTLTFTNAPVPFGAFPSLHSGSATMEALMLSYFFPVGVTLYKSAKRHIRLDMRIVYWAYAGWLYWCTMYLMHHFLIDLVAGGCLATICFYVFLSDEMREAMELHYAYRSSSPAPLSAAPGVLRPTSAFGVRRDGRIIMPDSLELNVSPSREDVESRATRGTSRGGKGKGRAVVPDTPLFALDDELASPSHSPTETGAEGWPMAPLYGGDRPVPHPDQGAHSPHQAAASPLRPLDQGLVGDSDKDR